MTNKTLAFRSCIAAGIMMSGFSAGPVASAEVDSLKAAIVFNIARFATFTSDAGQPVTICVRRGDPSAAAFGGLDGRRLGDRPIHVRMMDVSTMGTGCNIAYLGQGGTGDIARIRQRGVLVIGDGADFIDNGGAVGLVRFGNQIRFEINARATRQSGIAISSKLMRLASRVQM